MLMAEQKLDYIHKNTVLGNVTGGSPVDDISVNNSMSWKILIWQIKRLKSTDRNSFFRVYIAVTRLEKNKNEKKAFNIFYNIFCFLL